MSVRVVFLSHMCLYDVPLCIYVFLILSGLCLRYMFTVVTRDSFHAGYDKVFSLSLTFSF